MKFSVGVVSLMLLSFFSCTNTTQKVDSERKVKCELVGLVGYEMDHSSFAGKVVAASDVNLGFRVPGIIERICVKDGEFVKDGDVVALLDDRDYKLQLEATQAEYDGIKSEVDRIVALYHDQSVSAKDYDKAVNGLRAITAKLEAHKNALNDCRLRASMDAYVVKTNFDKGEAVAAGTPVVSLIAASKPQITIDIPSKYYLKQANYKSATARVDLYGDTEFNLKLRSVSPKSNLNQLFRVTFDVEPKDGVLPSVGVSAMVDISYKAKDDVLVSVPFSSITQSEGECYVWVVEDNIVSKRRVEIEQIKREGLVYIKKGLVQGEKVVSAGVNSLKEGQKVSPMSEVSKSNVGAIK